MNIRKYLKQLDLWLFLSSVFFLKIPNFYLLFFIKNSFFTTQALARIFIVFVFSVILFKLFIQKDSLFKKNSYLSTIVIICFITFFTLQSLSVISAVNISAFLSRYKDIFLSFIGFFCFYYFRQNYKLIILTIILGSIVSLIYQSIIFFFPDFFIHILSNLIYDKHVLLVIANIHRSRIYTDTYDEIAIPFLMLHFLPTYYFANSVVVLIISFFSAVSNFRTRILMLLFSLICSAAFIKKISLQIIIIIYLSLILIALGASSLLSNRFGFSYVDRLLLADERTDIDTINSRVDQIKTGLQQGTYSFFGVGLGNYYDNLPVQMQAHKSGQNWEDIQNSGASLYIHNNIASVVAESGYASALVFILILIIFSIQDSRLLFKGKDYQKALIIAFWTLFLHGLFNPTVPLSYQFFFWGLRGTLLDS